MENAVCCVAPVQLVQPFGCLKRWPCTVSVTLLCASLPLTATVCCNTKIRQDLPSLNLLMYANNTQNNSHVRKHASFTGCCKLDVLNAGSMQQASRSYKAIQLAASALDRNFKLVCNPTLCTATWLRNTHIQRCKLVRL